MYLRQKKIPTKALFINYFYCYTNGMWTAGLPDFLAHDTKTGKNVPNGHKKYQMDTKVPNDIKISQMSIKYFKRP
jgi:hypothetical protein